MSHSTSPRHATSTGLGSDGGAAVAAHQAALGCDSDDVIEIRPLGMCLLRGLDTPKLVYDVTPRWAAVTGGCDGGG